MMYLPVAEEEDGTLGTASARVASHMRPGQGGGRSPKLLRSLARCALCVLRCLLFKPLSSSLAGRPATSREAAPCLCNPAPAQEARPPSARTDPFCFSPSHSSGKKGRKQNYPEPSDEVARFSSALSPVSSLSPRSPILGQPGGYL